MTVVDRYRCWNLRALPFCSTRYICEVNVKMPLLSWTDGLPHSFSPPIRSQKSHVSDDICSDSSAGVFHSEPGLKTSLQRVCGAALCSEVCMCSVFVEEFTDGGLLFRTFVKDDEYSDVQA